MGSVHDALKRAEQQRQKEAAENSAGPPPSGGIVRRAATPDDATPPPLANPLTVALQRGKNSPAGELAATRQADVVLENYLPKAVHLDPRLVAYQDRTGPAADQYRTVRDHILAGHGRGQPQMVVFTASVAGEGATTTTANLGLSFAELRHLRVLLVDGDMQHGTLSDYWKYPHARGLAELLASTDKPQAYLQATPWPNLFVLPSGAVRSPQQCMDLLRTPAARQILRQLRGTFDVVLVDAPPALRFPDAGLLAACGDGAVLAVRLNRTSRRTVQRALRTFRAMNVPVRGCVLTGAGA